MSHISYHTITLSHAADGQHAEKSANPSAGRRSGLTRRDFLSLMGTGALLTPLALAGCGSSEKGASAPASDAVATDLNGLSLTFVGDDAFAPFRSIETQATGSQKVVGLDIDVMDEMARRLGFTYNFEAQDFTATLASVQGSDTSFTMPMSSNDERRKTFDFTRGYYQPLVGVLTLGEEISTIDGLRDKSIACTTGTVQNTFVSTAVPNADVHTYDGGDQCLQEVLAGRIDAYVCDGAEGRAMQQANPTTVLGLLPRADTTDYVSVYRIMARRGATFLPAFDACVADLLADGTIDSYITKWIGTDFVWGDAASAATSAE